MYFSASATWSKGWAAEGFAMARGLRGGVLSSTFGSFTFGSAVSSAFESALESARDPRAAFFAGGGEGSSVLDSALAVAGGAVAAGSGAGPLFAGAGFAAGGLAALSVAGCTGGGP